jgi:hypothetical protein
VTRTPRLNRSPSIACAAICAIASTVGAQTPEGVDAIRCWWRTSNGAVAIGEPFDATLTCAVRDQESVRTVADESRLPAAVIQLAPFEVVGGSHPADISSATHRFFQYHYTLRIIDRDAIGHDVAFPDLQLSYRVHSKTSGEWVEGRDRTYVMPGRPMRVLSLVPTAADDIRDSMDEDFARIAALRFRSRALSLAAIAGVVLGGLLAAPALVGLLRRGKPADERAARHATRRAVLSAVDTELAAVSADARGGWTADLASRALAALRLAASCALNREVATKTSTDGATPGWLMTASGLLRRRPLALSSPVTSLDIRRAIGELPVTSPHEHQQRLERLADAMDTLTGALYGARFDSRAGRLDEAVAAGRAAALELNRRA